MSGYICQYCDKMSGIVRDSRTKQEKPAMSELGCKKSPDNKHKWVKK